MTDFILYLSIGVISGFLSSTPLGPINLWVANYQLTNRPHKNLYLFLTAVILVDVLYAGIGIWGQFELFEQASEVKWAGIISGVFTIVIGFSMFFYKKVSNPDKVVIPRFHSFSVFFQGLLLTGVNPSFLLFWIFVANQIFQRLDKSLAGLEILIFLVGVFFGDLLWFSLFLQMMKRLSKKISSQILRTFRKLIGAVFIIIGLYSVGSYIVK